MDYQDMVYNAHTVLRDYYTYEEILWMPLRDVMAKVKFFTPKLKEIARYQEGERLKAEMTGTANQRKPGIKRGS